MRFDILTIFPEIFTSYLSESIIKRALQKNLIQIHIHNIRDYSTDKHKKVDDIPYGGGAGMVMTPQPLYSALEAVKKLNKGKVIYFSPRGKILTQPLAEKMIGEFQKTQSTQSSQKNKKRGLILLCGRYEGIDQRIIDLCVDEELSIGKFVLTGGELPAMVLIDCLSRLIPGVLGKEESHQQESFSKNLSRKKEYPHYTRPAVFKKLKVPEILLSGNHAKIKNWRLKNLG